MKPHECVPKSWDDIDFFRDSRDVLQSGLQLEMIQTEAADFRSWFLTAGQPSLVETRDLFTIGYPSEYGLFRIGSPGDQLLTLAIRFFVVRWYDDEGVQRTLLFEPPDEQRAGSPAFTALVEDAVRNDRSRLAHFTRGTSVIDELAELDIAPEEVDYIAYDHLHVQDLRRLIGDAAGERSNEGERDGPLLPRAKLIVQQREWDSLARLHPLQRPWYQPETFKELSPERLLFIDGDVLLGPGVALLATPGHTVGNQTLVLNTSTGIWAISENAVAAECFTPELSQLEALARYAETSGCDVLLNGNSLEGTAHQYNSMLKEKLIVDVRSESGGFLQYLPSSELLPCAAPNGLNPTLVHGAIEHVPGNAPAVVSE